MKTMTANLIRAAVAGSLLIAASAAHAAKSDLEKVDAVQEGIDLKPIVVNANANGYHDAANQPHRFMMRLYAKARGSNAVYIAGVSNDRHAVTKLSQSRWYHLQEARGSDGWGTYTKSVAFDAKPSSVGWRLSPVDACNVEMRKNAKSGDALRNWVKSEHKVTAEARFFFGAAADSKGHNRGNKHNGEATHFGAKEVIYKVPVTCSVAK